MPTSSSTTRIWAMASGRLRARQEDADRSAAARAVLDRHAAVVLVDDLLHDGEPEAHTARFGGHVGLEDTRHQLLRETAAVVRDRQPDAVSGELGAHLDRWAH